MIPAIALTSEITAMRNEINRLSTLLAEQRSISRELYLEKATYRERIQTPYKAEIIALNGKVQQMALQLNAIKSIIYNND